MSKPLLAAWDGKFSSGQLQDIRNMSRHAERSGMKLYDVLEKDPPRIKENIYHPRQKKWHVMCPECGKAMNLSDVSKQSEKYQQGFRTYLLCGAACCSKKGCGYEIFSKLTKTEILNRRSLT